LRILLDDVRTGGLGPLHALFHFPAGCVCSVFRLIETSAHVMVHGAVKFLGDRSTELA
jgi:hypothetical protein